MPNPAERKAIEIADEFLSAGLEDDAHIRAWLIIKIWPALEEAEERGYKRAMAKRF